MTTPSAQDAERAIRGELEMVGKGMARKVYMGRCGEWVYKVEHGCDVQYAGGNLEEYCAAKLLRSGDLPEDVYIPKVFLFSFGGRTVLAMEYISGETDESGNGEFILDECLGCGHDGIADMHERNYLVWGGDFPTYVPIDLGWIGKSSKRNYADVGTKELAHA